MRIYKMSERLMAAEGKNMSLIPKVVAFVILWTVALAEYVFSRPEQDIQRSSRCRRNRHLRSWVN